MSLIVDKTGVVVLGKPTESEGSRANAAGNLLVTRLAGHIEALGLSPIGVASEFRYASLPLCVIDSVFSIGVRYTTTKATVERFCERTGWLIYANSRDNRAEGNNSLSQLVALYNGHSSTDAADTLFRNRQRTSTRSGILKAEAVKLFAEALLNCGIDVFADISPERLELAEAAILGLPGQSSGIAFDYFRMLAGDDNVVKPDRMVQRFVGHALGLPSLPSPRQCAVLLRLTAKELAKTNSSWTPLRLDFAIWSFQSAKTQRGNALPPNH